MTDGLHGGFDVDHNPLPHAARRGAAHAHDFKLIVIRYLADDGAHLSGADVKRGDADLLSRFRVQDAERLIENANRISFIDAAREDRIVLSFSTPGTEKTVRQENRPEAKKPNTPPKKG